MSEGVIGTARVDITADVSGLQAAITTAKQSVSSMSESAVTEYNRLNTVEKRRIDTLIKQADTVNMSKAQQIAYNAALKGTPTSILDELTRKLESSGSAAQQAGKQFSAHGLSIKQQAAALRGVPAQVTDIMVSLQGGQRPLTVLLQQGGQLKDMFGGVVPAAQALGSVVAGMVNPFMIAGVAAVGLATAFVIGQSEAEKFSRSMTLTGNYAAITANQYALLTTSISDSIGTQSAAADALNQLAATGKITGSQMELIGKASVAMSQVTDTSVTEMVKRFAELGDNPVAASAALDKQYHYLTTSIYEQIIALNEQGRQEDAAALAQNTYANAVIDRVGSVKKELGFLEASWIGVKNAANDAWDGMLSIGRKRSDTQTIADNEVQIARLKNGAVRGRNYSAATGNKLANTAEIERIEAENVALRNKVVTDTQAAKVQAAKNKTTADGNAAVTVATKLVDQYSSKQEKLNKALDDYHRQNAKIRASNPNSPLLDPKVIAQTEKGMRDSIKDKTHKPKVNVAARAGAQYMAGVEADRASLEQEIDNLTRGLDVTKLTEAEKKINDLNAQLRIPTVKYRKGQASDSDINAQIAELHKQVDLEKQRDALKKKSEINKTVTSGLNGAGTDAQKYIDGLANEVDMIGATTAARKQAALMLDMESKARELVNQAAKKAGLSDEEFRRTNPDVVKNIQDRTQALTAQQLDAYDQYQDVMSSFSTGWDNAFSSYVENATNAATQAGSIFATMSKGMENALTSFFTTGKLGWKEFASSVLTEIVRIQAAKLAAGLLTTVAGMFVGGASSGASSAGSTPSGVSASNVGSLSFSSMSANGNAFYGGQPLYAYADGGAFTNSVVSSPTVVPQALFGEAGPEAIMPLARDSSGRLGVHASGSAKSGGVMIEQNFYIQKDTTSTEQVGDAGIYQAATAEMAASMEAIARKTIMLAMYPGGAISTVYGNRL